MPNNIRIFAKINDCIVSDRHSLPKATKNRPDIRDGFTIAKTI